MFGIEFETEDASKAHAWQNSWGLTTRSIGVMVMTHADDKGLVLPPRVAPKQIVLIPIPKASNGPEMAAAMAAKVAGFASALEKAGVRCTQDCRENYTPGWKYNHWELKGVPARAPRAPRARCFPSRAACAVLRCAPRAPRPARPCAPAPPAGLPRSTRL